MKQRLKDAGIALLALISAALMLFSAYGLYSRFKGQSADTPLEEMHQPGENPTIDEAIVRELTRIADESNFVWQHENNVGPYAGSRSDSFTNTTGSDFSDFYLQIELYQVDDPSLYELNETIPYDPLETHQLYRGALKDGQTIPISFETYRDDYNFVMLGYNYAFSNE